MDGVKDFALLGFVDNNMYDCERVKIFNLVNIPIIVKDFQRQKIDNRDVYIFLFQYDNNNTEYKCFTTALTIKKQLDKANEEKIFPFRCKVVSEKGRYYKFVSAQ